MATTGSTDPPSYSVAVNADEKQTSRVPQPVPRYFYPQKPVTQGGHPVQQVQYTVPGAAVPPVDVTQRPSYKAPHTYLVITVIVMGICSILNPTSLAFGVPALIMAIMATHSAGGGHYPEASSQAKIVLFLNITNVIYTLLFGLVVAISTAGSICCFVR